MSWSVELYKKENGQIPVLEFLKILPSKHRAKADRSIEILRIFGLKLKEPHTKHIEGDLWELRIKFSNDISRIFYFVSIEDKFVLLHGFVKKSHKTPKRELDTAKIYMSDYLRRCPK